MNQEYKKKYLKYKRKYLNLEISRIKGGNKQIGGSTYIILGGLLVFIITAIIGSYILINRNKVESKNNTNIHTEHIITTNQHYEQRIIDLIQQLDNCRREKTETQAQQTQEIKELMQKLGDCETEIELSGQDYCANNSTLQKRIEKQEDTLTRFRLQWTELINEKSGLEKKIGQLQAQQAQQTQEIAELTKRIGQLQEEKNNLKLSGQKHCADNSILQKQIEELTKIIGQLEETLGKLESELEVAKGKIGPLKFENTRLYETINLLQTGKSEQEQQLEELTTILKGKESENNDLKQKIKQLEEAYESEKKQIQQESETLKSEIKELVGKENWGDVIENSVTTFLGRFVPRLG